MVALRTWGSLWSGKTIRIHCDNEAVVTVLSTGKTKDLTLAAIARNVWLSTAEYDICLRTVHIRGKDNAIADSLSRWFISQNHRNRVQTLLPYATWDQIPINATVINWSIYIFSGLPSQVAALTAKAKLRMNSAYASSTSKSYNAKF